MPLLALLLVDMLGAVAAYLAKYLTQKTAVTVIVLAQLVILFGGFYLSGRVALQGVAHIASHYSPMFAAGIQAIVSPRTVTAITSYLTFMAACELFKWRFTIIQLWGRVI